jgi:hypothetical protein
MKTKDRFCLWLSFKLPRRLAYWCAVRVNSAATVGRWGNEFPDQTSVVTALKRWEMKP